MTSRAMRGRGPKWAWIEMLVTQTINDDVTRHGYAFVPDYCPGMDTVSIAQALGRPLTPGQGGLVQNLIARTAAPPNTYSGLYGLDRFPFHTDLAHWQQPPRYLLLRCVIGYADVPTLLIDGQTVINAVPLDILTRAIVKPRRPRGGALTLMRLWEAVDNGHRLRWDDVFLKPASKIGEVADQQVRLCLDRTEPLSIALVRSGDTLLIDNWRMLHARSPIPAGREDRKIERIYLEGLH
jgi:L-asparagine oxygenase